MTVDSLGLKGAGEKVGPFAEMQVPEGSEEGEGGRDE